METRNRDARITLTPSEDGMEVRGLFLPARGQGEPLSREACGLLLVQEGIVHGVDWPLIESLLQRLAAGEGPLDEVIARGTPAEDADPAYLKLAKKFFTVRLYGRERGGRVDFREARPFVVVDALEALGRFLPAAEGVPGRDVYGATIEPGVKNRIPFIPAENTCRQGDYLRATIAGRFNLQHNRIFISEVLELQGVDFHTGNIRYPGDVVLRGEVGDGFSVICGGDLNAAVPLDVTDIQVGGDLTVEGGILGRTPGRLQLAGNLTAKFLENLELDCRGDVHTSGGILQSQVHTLGKVRCGERGRIINSRIYALGGVEAQQLGNSAGQLTLISSGSDFRQLRRLKEIRARKQRLKLKLATLEGLKNGNLISASVSPRIAALYDDAKRMIGELDEAADMALRGIESNPEARVESRDTIFPGVTIEICQVIRRITSPLPRGIFYLDAGSRTIKLIDS